MEIVLYIAASLDGYIATSDGSVDWLSVVEEEGEDYGYKEFYGSVDGLVMGSKTYEQILGFGEWPYAGKPCWVCTSRRLETAAPGVVLTSREPTEVVAELKAQNLHRIWLVGGGRLAASFGKHNLISEYIISVIPVLLGEGIPLFPAPGQKAKLTLADSKSYASGLAQLRYYSKENSEQQ